jgi:hypothetical protein
VHDIALVQAQCMETRSPWSSLACHERCLAPMQVERLQRKFATIHSTLAQQQTQKPAEPPLPSPLRSSVPSSINVAESFPKARSTAGACRWCSISRLHTACIGMKLVRGA